MKKIIVIGANGTIGKHIVKELESDHEIIRVSKTHSDRQVDLTSESSVRELFESTGKVDAVIAAVGKVHFGPLSAMTTEQFFTGLNDKLMGQVRLVLIGKNYINTGGSFTLTSGILTDHPIRTGVNATTVNAAVEGFVLAAATELSGIRINAVSPTVLTESLDKYAAYFPGFESVCAERVAKVYRRSVMGVDTGKIFHAGW